MKQLYRFLVLCALWSAIISPALAQSGCPTIQPGVVLTAAQWNACFALKQNNLGYTPLNKAGDVMLGYLVTNPSGILQAGFNLPQGVAPTTPANGDLWTTSVGLFVQINGSTVGPLGTGGGGGGSITFGGQSVAVGGSAVMQGNGGKIQAATGSTTSGDCLQYDVNGNAIDLGGPCVAVHTTVYVQVAGSGGSDSNDCLSSSVSGGHGPCLTIQHALNVLIGFDNNSGTCASSPQVNIGAGTFVGALIDGNYRGDACGGIPGNAIAFFGAGSASTIINDTQTQCGAFVVSGAARVQFYHMTITKTAGCGGGGSDIFGQNEADIYIQTDVILGAAGSARIHLEANTHFETNSAITITGTAAYTMNITGNSGLEIDPSSTVITCSSANDTTAHVYADTGGYASIRGLTYSGCSGFTGAQYVLVDSGQIQTTAGVIATLPGIASLNVMQFGGWIDPPPASTCSSTGIGSTGTCTISTGSNQYAGTISLTPSGTGIAASGNATLTLPAKNGPNATICVFFFQNLAASWLATAFFQAEPGVSASGVSIVTWNNNGTPLTSGSAVGIKYICLGR